MRFLYHRALWSTQILLQYFLFMGNWTFHPIHCIFSILLCLIWKESGVLRCSLLSRFVSFECYVNVLLSFKLKEWMSYGNLIIGFCRVLQCFELPWIQLLANLENFWKVSLPLKWILSLYWSEAAILKETPQFLLMINSFFLHIRTPNSVKYLSFRLSIRFLPNEMISDTAMK